MCPSHERLLPHLLCKATTHAVPSSVPNMVRGIQAQSGDARKLKHGLPLVGVPRGSYEAIGTIINRHVEDNCYLCVTGPLNGIIRSKTSFSVDA